MAYQGFTLKSALLLATVAVSGAAQADTTAPQKLGFVVTTFTAAVNENIAADCPQGMATIPNEDAALARIVKRFPNPKQKLNDLGLQANFGERYKLLAGRGPGNEDVCQSPEAVVETPLPPVQSKIAPGLPLDGGRAPGRQCAHEKFTGADGTSGIDNQLYRTVGCVTSVRQDGGYVENSLNQMMLDGEATILIEVRGVTDMRHDNVEIGIYQGLTTMPKDASGKRILADGSYKIDPNPQLHNVTRGTIIDGVLTTEPIDMRFHRATGGKDMDMWLFRDARLRVTIKPESAAGIFAAYQDWEPIYRQKTKAGAFTERYQGLTCPAFYAALKRNADGYRDESGQCTAISLAYKVEAIPAFLFHPDKQTAAASEGAQK